MPRSRRKTREPENAQPGDFLIVTRNTANLSRYADELQALGVPHQVTGGTSLNESEELRLLCTCLRVFGSAGRSGGPGGCASERAFRSQRRLFICVQAIRRTILVS